MAPIRQHAWRLSGIALLALALIAVFTPKGGREVDRDFPAASPGRIAEGSNGIADRPEEPPMKATKVDRIRPTREEHKRKNSEQRRVELAAGLQKLKAGGLGAQHPAMKASTDQISKDPDIRIQPTEKNTVILWTRNQIREGSNPLFPNQSTESIPQAASEGGINSALRPHRSLTPAQQEQNNSSFLTRYRFSIDGSVSLKTVHRLLNL